MNKITIELCAEDRARLDKLNELLEAQITLTSDILDKGLPTVKPTKSDELTETLKAVVEEVKNPVEPPEISTPPVTPKAEEAPTPTEEAQPAPAEPAKPSVTLAQIQQKVVQLAAGYNGSKKAAVREVINAYAKKVSDLPEDKWDEVWSKLTALESEG